MQSEQSVFIYLEESCGNLHIPPITVTKLLWCERERITLNQQLMRVS